MELDRCNDAYFTLIEKDEYTEGPFVRIIPDNDTELFPEYVLSAFTYAKIGMTAKELETSFRPKYFGEHEMLKVVDTLVKDGKILCHLRPTPLEPFYTLA